MKRTDDTENANDGPRIAPTVQMTDCGVRLLSADDDCLGVARLDLKPPARGLAQARGRPEKRLGVKPCHLGA